MKIRHLVSLIPLLVLVALVGCGEKPVDNSLPGGVKPEEAAS